MGHQDFATDAIEQRLLDDEAAIARHRASQMSLLRELDRRQAPLRDGCRSLKEWATGRMDLAPETAGMLVTTARRLQNLPDIDAAVTTGEIGFDRAVAVSRLAGRDDALDLLGETTGCDIDGIRVLAARRRRMSRLDEIQSFAERYVSIQPNLDESSWRLSGRLPGFAGRTVVAALEARGDTFPYGPDVTPPRTTMPKLWGALRGSIDVAPGVDLTEPVLAEPLDAEQGILNR